MTSNGTSNGHGNGRSDPIDPQTAWIAYKRSKALAFVNRGYSVEWAPDDDHWMGIYTPQRYEHPRTPEVRATVKFFEEPSASGIDGGRVSKLHIQVIQRDLIKQVFGEKYQTGITLYNFDRGLDVDRLRPRSPPAKLYRDVIDLLN